MTWDLFYIRSSFLLFHTRETELEVRLISHFTMFLILSQLLSCDSLERVYSCFSFIYWYLIFHNTSKQGEIKFYPPSPSVFQTFSGCSLTVCMTRTSSRRMLSTNGSPAKIPPSSTARVWPSSLSRPSSPGCGRRRRSRKIIDKRGTPRGLDVVELHPHSRTNKQTFKMGVWAGRHVYGWNFFLRYGSETYRHFEFGFQRRKH